MKHRGLLTFILLGLALFFFACSSNDDPVDTGDTTPVLSAGDEVSFTLIQTTDVHHHVVGTGPSASYGTDSDTTKGGYSRIARVIQNIRTVKGAQGIPTVLVDSGDFFMGTVYDMSLAKSPAAFNFFESMDYDAVTLGNHEFDYGPAALGSFFYRPLPEDASATPTIQFDVPVVMSNMVTDQVADTDDDYLESLYLAGEMKTSMLLTLDNGLKVGILGLFGASAEADAPLTSPVTFVNDLTDADDVAAIQAMVDDLKNNQGAHVVIVLSHGGIVDPDSGSPTGDDIDLANAVTGIDIIASGHQHEMTSDVVTVGDTKIICAGSYGENVAQLDVTVTVGTGVTGTPTLTNNTIDDTVDENDVLKMFLVGVLDSGINEALVENGLPEVNDVMAYTDSDNLGMPDSAGETGIGNLVSDSLRALPVSTYVAMGGTAFPCMSIVPNGVIRNGFSQSQSISFADIYNTLPLGMTPIEANQTIPGYPLLFIYLDATSIRSLCQISAFAIAAAEGNPYLAALKSDYYLNFSGIRYSYGTGNEVEAANVYIYDPTDYTCSSDPVAPISAIGALGLPSGSYLPCVVDLYTALVFLSSDMQALISQLNGYVDLFLGVGFPDIEIQPKINVGTMLSPTLVDITENNVLADGLYQGTQDIKAWMALYGFIQNLPEAPSSTPENPIYFIPNAVYGDTMLGSGSASRVNP